MEEDPLEENPLKQTGVPRFADGTTDSRNRSEPHIEENAELQQVMAILYPTAQPSKARAATIAGLIARYPAMDHVTEATKCIGHWNGEVRDPNRAYVNWLTERAGVSKQYVLKDGTTSTLATAARPLARTAPPINRAVESDVPPLPPTFPPTEVPFWHELARYVVWLSDRAKLPARNMSDELVWRMVATSWNETTGTLTMRSTLSDGSPFVRGTEKGDQEYRDVWSTTLRRVAKSWLKRDIVVQWTPPPTGSTQSTSARPAIPPSRSSTGLDGFVPTTTAHA